MGWDNYTCALCNFPCFRVFWEIGEHFLKQGKRGELSHPTGTGKMILQLQNWSVRRRVQLFIYFGGFFAVRGEGVAGGMVLSSQAQAFPEVLQKLLRQVIMKWVSASRSHVPATSLPLAHILTFPPLLVVQVSHLVFPPSSVSLPLSLCCPPSCLLSWGPDCGPVDWISGKLFGNPNLSEIIWLQPPLACWFGGIRTSVEK